MISCYELRIGNYVLTQNGLRQISAINHTSSLPDAATIELQDGSADNQMQHTSANIQPVPMSDDVLKQSGFVYHNYFKFWQFIADDGSNRVEMDIDGDYNILDFMRKPIVKKVSSLHQLQNIYFFLKGRELNFQPALKPANVK